MDVIFSSALPIMKPKLRKPVKFMLPTKTRAPFAQLALRRSSTNSQDGSSDKDRPQSANLSKRALRRLRKQAGAIELAQTKSPDITSSGNNSSGAP